MIKYIVANLNIILFKYSLKSHKNSNIISLNIGYVAILGAKKSSYSIINTDKKERISNNKEGWNVNYELWKHVPFFYEI